MSYKTFVERDLCWFKKDLRFRFDYTSVLEVCKPTFYFKTRPTDRPTPNSILFSEARSVQARQIV